MCRLNQYANLLGLTPEQIAPDQWATSTTFSPTGPNVVHHRDLQPIEGFTSHLSRLVFENTPGEAEVVIRWADDDGYPIEEFSIAIDKIPVLIAVLHEAHRIGT